MADMVYSNEMIRALGDINVSFNESLSEYDERIENYQSTINLIDEYLDSFGEEAEALTEDQETDPILSEIMNGEDGGESLNRFFYETIAKATTNNVGAYVATIEKLQKLTEGIRARAEAEQLTDFLSMIKMCRAVIETALTTAIENRRILLINMERIGLLAKEVGATQL
ncbi:MAG: hypothetical protein K5894_07440 [Lachnospiraceae bacterium]|nr:hypothetical protein [Lachnospiraceae bacterium]